MINDELISLLRSLKEKKEREFYGLKGMTELYIKNKETDTSKIEHLLDDLLDTCMDVKEANQYFFMLCDYLETIDKEASDDYRVIFKELYVEDYDDKDMNSYQRNISR